MAEEPDTILVGRPPEPDNDYGKWLDTLRLTQAIPVDSGMPGVLAGGFRGVWGAARAVTQLVPPGSAGTAAFCGADGNPADALHKALLLLKIAGPGQILTTAATAIIAGLALPSDVSLVDRGIGPDGDRIYQLRPTAPAVEPAPPSNLDWARRAVDAAGAAPVPPALQRQWQGALDGRPQLVVLSDALPPADRTAVAAEFALRCHAEGALVLYGRWEPDPPVPAQALREALGRYADGLKTAKLRAELAGWTDEIGRLLPEVAARAGHPHLARRGWADTGRLPEAVEAWLLILTAQRPALLVLDEAQWADDVSLQVLTHLWHVWRHGSLMVLLTDRPEVESPGLANLLDLAEHGGDGAFTRISVP